MTTDDQTEHPHVVFIPRPEPPRDDPAQVFVAPSAIAKAAKKPDTYYAEPVESVRERIRAELTEPVMVYYDQSATPVPYAVLAGLIAERDVLIEAMADMISDAEELAAAQEREIELLTGALHELRGARPPSYSDDDAYDAATEVELRSSIETEKERRRVDHELAGS